MTTLSLLDQPISNLAGVGLQTADRLKKLDLFVIRDLLFHLPLRYEDRTCLRAINKLTIGSEALICGHIESIEVLSRNKPMLVCRIKDDTGFIALKFFHYHPNQFKQFKVGARISCYAEVRIGLTGLEMVHPDYSIISDSASVITQTSLTPVYPLTEGISQKTLRRLVSQALALCSHNPELLSEIIHEIVPSVWPYPTLLSSMQTLHAPKPAMQEDINLATKRLAFEELLTHYAQLKNSREQSGHFSAPLLSNTTNHARNLLKQFIDTLPFSLTNAQRRVMAEIEADCGQVQPMMRLVQGDVGSGKTVVAAYAVLLALANGYQVAVMAPTELLAEQHFRNFQIWFKNFPIKVLYLTGQIKGNARQNILQTLQEESSVIIIGTHALFQEQVNFCRLGLIVIDEQHRFGVHQRLALREKGQSGGTRPHQLVMTATPIPRTLAMVQYADLEVSVIDELPPTRKPVITRIIPAERREEVIRRIQQWIQEKDKQVYWVCTLIEESEILQCEAVEQTIQYLTAELPSIRMGSIHGRMSSTDKEAVMLAFKNQQIDLLVATTVIEVGVDVPNASLMIIENPERLGLAQLHQLRGRVGRGDSDSYCLLMYQSPLAQNARQRLAVLRESSDGFVIAEKDLALRGPGELMGTRQTGAIRFKVADPVRDADMINDIRQSAEKLLTQMPEQLEPLRNRWLGASSRYADV